MTSRWVLGARVLLGAAVVATVWTSLLPPDDLPAGFGLYDKAVHAVGYGLLAALALVSGLRWPFALAAAVGLGLVLEVAQGLLGYRSFEWWDLAADAAGATVAVLLLRQPVEAWHRRAAEQQAERRREARRERRARAKRAPERPMNPARAAARSGPPTWQQVARRQGDKCWLCGTRTWADDRRRVDAGRERLGATYPVVDLVVPLDRGGTYARDNLRVAHRHCRDVRVAQPARTEFGRPPRTFLLDVTAGTVPPCA